MKYEAMMMTARANFNSLVSNPQSIPEHSDIVSESERWVEQMDKALAMKQALDELTK